MSNIGMVYTRMGLMIGEVLGHTKNGAILMVNKPALVNMTPNAVALVPFLAITQDNHVILGKADVFFEGQVFTPAIEILNHYNQQFGSGIEIATKIH